MVGGGTVPPAIYKALPLDVAPLTTRFLGAIIDLKRVFEEGFWWRDLEFGSERKHQFVVEIFRWWIFFAISDQTVSQHHK